MAQAALVVAPTESPAFTPLDSRLRGNDSGQREWRRGQWDGSLPSLFMVSLSNHERAACRA